MHKTIAASLATAVVLAGLVATPAQAFAVSNPTPSPSSSPSASQSTAPAVPTATPTPSAVATPKPTATVAPKVTQQATPQSESTPAPAAVKLQANTVSGDLLGKNGTAAKETWLAVRGQISQETGVWSRNYTIEIYSPSTKKWSTYKSGTTVPGGLWYDYLEATKDDSQTFRLVVEADSTHERYVGPATVYQRTKAAIKIYNLNMPNTTIHSVPWEQQKFNVGVSRYLSGVTLELQKLQNKKWVTVSKIATNPKVTEYSFNLPKGNSKSKDGTLSYRVASAATVDYSGASSSATNVRWENPYLYKGTARTAYNYSAGKCPAVLIRMDGNLHKSGRWGQASLGTIPKSMSLSTKIPSKHLKTVALHECSHFYQWDTANNKNNKGWAAYKAAANKLMGTTGETGMERVNECMSASWGGHSYWSYGATAKICAKPAVKDFAQKSLKGQKVT